MFELESDVDRFELFWLTLRFFDDVSTASYLFLQFRLQIFRRRAGIFSHFFLCCFYFLFKLHVNFSLMTIHFL